MGLFWLSGGVFLGWALGANDASNMFGTAVGTRTLSFRTAAIFMATGIVAGALLEGHGGLDTLRAMGTQTIHTAFIITCATALGVAGLTWLKLPVSTSQAVVGAIIGVGLPQGELNTHGLGKVVLCWIGTPIGAGLIAIAAYWVFYLPYSRMSKNVILVDGILTVGLIATGAYGSYALGANNVANTTGVFVGLNAGPVFITPFLAAAVGSTAIALGAVTFSKRVMMTVGKNLALLDHYTAFIATLSCAVTTHIYASLGVPVSTSQAIVGAVFGVGLLKGVRTVNLRMLRSIVLGWCATPILAALLAAGISLVWPG